jgi:phospholipid N-methyltransferase
MTTRRSTLDVGLFMFREFLRDRRIASVKTTSPYLVHRICRRLNLSGRRVVVEFGPGPGCITRVLLDLLSADSMLILIETNPEFVKRLRRVRDPRLHVVSGSAVDVKSILRNIGVPRVDAVVSGIPFSFFDEAPKMKLLTETRSVLADDGVFLAYQSSASLEKPLRRIFPRVRVERQLFHIPPLAILEARAA